MDDHLEDDAMDAECRVLGTLMLDPGFAQATPTPLMIPLYGFQSSFHASVFLEIMRLQKLGEISDPVTVWEGVSRHQDAEDFGLEHLADLVAEAANPDSFRSDCATLIEWAAHRSAWMAEYVQAVIDASTAVKH